MRTWYVATLSCYALVQAEDPVTAQLLGKAELQKNLGRNLRIATVREATVDEIEFQQEHEEYSVEEGLLRDRKPKQRYRVGQ